MTEKLSILVIEDQLEVSRIMVYLLTRAGWKVTTAQSGIEGLHLAQAENFDLITLDIDLLGDMDGFEICRQLKQDSLLKEIPVVFVSGRSDEEDRSQAFQAGAADYVTKPFDVWSFATRLRAHITSNAN